MSNLKRRVVELLENILSIRWIVVGIALYLYGLGIKKELVGDALQSGVSYNAWDISLRFSSDLYVIVYFIVPLVFFISIKSILINFNYLILIRMESIQAWLGYSFKSFWFNAFPLFFTWIMITFFLMIGFNFSWSWSEFYNTKDIFGAFNFPISALFFQFVLCFLTFSLIHLLASSLYVISQGKHILILFYVMMFLLNIFSFKLLPNDWAFLSPSTYMSITKAIITFDSPLTCFSIIVALGILNIIFIKGMSIDVKRAITLIKQYIPLILYTVLCTMGIVSAVKSLRKSTYSIADALIMTFRGSNGEDFSYIPFFFYIVVYIGFVYLLQVYSYKEIENLSYYKVIRYRNVHVWFWSWMKKILLDIVLFLIALIFLTALIAYCFNLKFNFHSLILDIPLYQVIYHLIINGFLQLSFYVFVLYLISWLSNNSSYLILTLSTFAVLMLPGLKFSVYLPVGLNSTTYLTEFSPYYLTLILISANLVVYASIFVISRKSLKI